MRLNQEQIDVLSKYFADLSKILVGSVIIGFFVPTSVGPITIPVFLFGSAVALTSLWASIRLVK